MFLNVNETLMLLFPNYSQITYITVCVFKNYLLKIMLLQ